MKLRLSGNSIRLRLSSAELNDFAVLGRIEEVVLFGPTAGGQFSFALESVNGGEVGARLEGSSMTVFVPSQIARNWTRSDQIGIASVQNTGGPRLEIAVEKDLGPRRAKADIA